MEIEELNHRLFDLTQSERAYRSGERYDWARSNRAIVYDGRSMVQMGDEVLGGVARAQAAHEQWAASPS